ncbi:hypothetical protein GH714_009460 [Hevea brasiliensis]|uniref:Malectin-like domain-containing protein n=1 Tax=Hevea brasiliensis TaxID=3981 RepID=A0A6A6MXW3_HEVBR|nr:hypothetical protein GH714_009460 [Hevea brasiliensis]
MGEITLPGLLAFLSMEMSQVKEYQPKVNPEVKEFSFNVTSDRLVLTFTPFANSIAFKCTGSFSLPDELIPPGATTIGPQGKYQNLGKQALETVESNVEKFLANVKAVNFTKGRLTENIAPSSVYGTATILNSDPDPQTNANVTWLFDVDPGFEYLVRFHFCDILPRPSARFYFNVYIGSSAVVQYFDLLNRTSDVGVPYFMDVITRVSGSRMLNVSIGPSNNVQYPNAILNGLEIMKISNAKDSLYVLDSISSKSSKTKVILIVGLAAGSLLIIVLALVLFLLCRRRSLADLSHRKAEDHFPMNEGDTVYTAGCKFSNGTLIFSTSKFVIASRLWQFKRLRITSAKVWFLGLVALERPVIDPSLPREKVNLVEWALKCQRRGQLEEIVDPLLQGQIKPDSLKKFGEIAEKCLAECGVYRPSMGDILWNLESALQLQGDEGRSNHNGKMTEKFNRANSLETGGSAAQVSIGSMGDLAGVSMSKVFAQMVREEMSNVHNHELLEDDQVRLLPAYRKIHEADQERILLLSKARSPAHRIVKVLELEKGIQGGQLPFLERDVRNFVQNRKKIVQDNDAVLTGNRENDTMELLEACKATKEVDEDFIYDCTVNENDKIENIARSFDNNAKTIYFGSVLLQEETPSSLVWALQAFIRLMKGKCPQTILTDLHMGLKDAISSESPSKQERSDFVHGELPKELTRLLGEVRAMPDGDGVAMDLAPSPAG